MQYKCFNVIRKWNWTDAAESKLNSACILNIFIIFYRIKKNPIMRKFDSRFKAEKKLKLNKNYTNICNKMRTRFQILLNW